MRDVTLTKRDDNYTFTDPAPTEPVEIFGLAGNDTINAMAGQGMFYISGGAGNDAIFTGRSGSTATFDVDGGSGNDVISGIGGTNHFVGGSGNDTLRGTFGNFYLEGGSGNDVLELGSFGSGLLEGGSGNDALTGNAQRGSFVMYGGSGDDRLTGLGNFSSFHEEYYGDSGNDTILAIGGDDLLDGGSGNDVLRGGDGSDELWGGSGRDVFEVVARRDSSAPAFTDVIEDFFDRHDTVRFIGTGLDFTKLAITQGADGAEIRYAATAAIVDTIVLRDVDVDDLAAKNFVFG